jgi:hypothetical protein
VFAQNGDAIFHDLQESARDLKSLVLPGGPDAHLALTKQDEHGCVSAQNADLTVPGRRNDLVGRALEDGPLRADD